MSEKIVYAGYPDDEKLPISLLMMLDQVDYKPYSSPKYRCWNCNKYGEAELLVDDPTKSIIPMPTYLWSMHCWVRVRFLFCPDCHLIYKVSIIY